MRTFHTSHKAFIYSKAGAPVLPLNQVGEAPFYFGAIYRQKSYHSVFEGRQREFSSPYKLEGGVFFFRFHYPNFYD